MKPTIYIDLDGTLLGHKASLIHNSVGDRSNASIDALRKAEDAGADLVIATGRDEYRASEFSRSVGIQKYIAELGCVIHTTGEQIIECGEAANTFISENNLSAVQFINVVTDAGRTLLAQNPGRLEMHTPYNRDQHATLLMRGNIDTEKANTFLQENGWPFLKIVANGHGMFRRTMPGVDNVLIYHLSPVGVSKASGIAIDQKLRNLDKQNCFMIGDGMADALCHENVNTVFMPINGPQSDEQVKLYAEKQDNIRILDHSHNEGFAQAIDIILGV